MGDRFKRPPPVGPAEVTPTWHQPALGGMGLMPYAGPFRSAAPLWRPVGTVLPRWSWFFSFLLAGAVLGVGVLALLTVGLLVVPFGLIALLLLATNGHSRSSWPGVLAGIALPVLWLAWLNGFGPGAVCTSGRCLRGGNPWVFLAIGVLLAVAGCAAFLWLRERAIRRQMSDPQDAWWPGGW